MSKILLAILDGMGLRDEEHGNAIKLANTSTLDELSKYPHTELIASGNEVGLPTGQMGNSETGHLNIGSGRIVYQPLELINNSIKNNTFYENEVLLKIMNYVKTNNTKLHIVGLISDGGVHSHIKHLEALLKMSKEKGIDNICMHLITDGRDTLPDVGYKYISEIENISKVSSICGRYYAMDRDNNMDRTEKYINMLTKGIAEKYDNTKLVFTINYGRALTDEFILPSLLDDNSLIKEEDGIIWFNFRPDRGKQIISSLSKYNKNIVTMMPISNDIKFPYAFKIEDINNTLGETLSLNNKKQLRIAETEKYAHVTYFFDGGVDKKLKKCDRILIKSPKVATYDMKPEMSSYEVTDKLLRKMHKYDAIILNFANGDMVGHTGNLNATIKAVEAVDANLKRIYDKANELGFTLIVTADHGNAEYMLDDSDNIITSHTTNKVPFIICKEGLSLKEGILADIAPTILELLNIEKPIEMTGESLIVK